MIVNDYSGVLDIIEDMFGQFHQHNPQKCQLSVDCPVCSYEIKELDHGDGKGNLEINYRDNIFRCWVCSDTHDMRGTLLKLIKKHGTKKHLKNYLLLRPDEVEIQQRQYKPIFLPKEFIPLTNIRYGLTLTPHYKQARNYLVNERKITDDIIKKYNIGYCYEGKYQGRIIIPSYDINNRINYFVARSYLQNSFLKYLNPDVQKETIIWNENQIDWNETIYIVEGVFDGVFLPNSIPLLGKVMCDFVFYKIYDNAKKDVVIILDPDARENQNKLYHKLNCGKLMNRVYVIELDGNKDVADIAGNLIGYEQKKIN